MKIPMICAVVMIAILVLLYVTTEGIPTSSPSQTSTQTVPSNDNALRGLKIQ